MSPGSCVFIKRGLRTFSGGPQPPAEVQHPQHHRRAAGGGAQRKADQAHLFRPYIKPMRIGTEDGRQQERPHAALSTRRPVRECVPCLSQSPTAPLLVALALHRSQSSSLLHYPLVRRAVWIMCIQSAIQSVQYLWALALPGGECVRRHKQGQIARLATTCDGRPVPTPTRATSAERETESRPVVRRVRERSAKTHMGMPHLTLS